MRYLMRQKFISLGKNYQIKDETGRNIFFVKHKNLSLKNKLSFQDMQGNELACIQQKPLSLGNTYNIYRHSELSATLKEPFFALIGRKFTVDIPGLDALKVKGNFTGYEYTFSRASGVVATVSKKWVALADTYGVDILLGEDDIRLLAEVGKRVKVKGKRKYKTFPLLPFTFYLPLAKDTFARGQF